MGRANARLGLSANPQIIRLFLAGRGPATPTARSLAYLCVIRAEWKRGFMLRGLSMVLLGCVTVLLDGGASMEV